MKKLAIFAAAFVLTLGLAQCKKEQPNAQITEGETVHITVNVGASTGSATNGSRADIADPSNSGHYTFNQGDILYVGYDGAKVNGELTYNNGQFSGDITLEQNGDQPLHFYYLGGGTATQVGETQQYTVDISDQTSNYPVISYGTSTQNYSASLNSYTTTLLNQCALVEFTTNEIPVETAVTISGMKNMVTVDFSNNTLASSSDETGFITLHAESATKRWAILLPDDEVETTAIAEGYYESDNFTVPPVAINGYLHGENGASLELYTPRTMPLTFEAKNANVTVKLMKSGSNAPVVNLDYSTDGITWNTFSPSSGVTLSNIGDKVMFRASTSNGAFGVYASRITYFNYFQITNECFVYGNIMSLLDKTSYPTTESIDEVRVFYGLFNDCSTLFSHDVKSLLLPATTLKDYCYSNMFKGCTSLTKAPELTAQELGQSCYSSMFEGCTSLTDVPDLPATTLKNNSYTSMFKGCTSLTKAPDLSATTLNQFCCRYMFEGCTRLTTAPTLRATTLASGCYQYMFRNCTSLTTAPTLLATELASACYQEMFNGCSSLNSITCLATTNITASNLNNWVKDVASSGTFTKASNATYITGTSGIPNGWTIVTQ